MILSVIVNTSFPETNILNADAESVVDSVGTDDELSDGRRSTVVFIFLARGHRGNADRHSETTVEKFEEEN